MTVDRAAMPCLFDLNLDEIPYTVPFSRLLVRAVGDALTVYRAAYEQSMDDSILASLVITDADGGVVPAIVASPYGIELSHHVGLVVTRHDTVHVGPLPPAFSCEITFRFPPQHLPLADRLLVPTDATVRVGRDTVWVSLPTGGDLAIVCDDRMPPHRSYGATAADVSAQVTAWLTRRPVVDTRWRALVQLCWWVLGSNQLELGGVVPGRAVVPAKLGYVGVWQWDAYFIAIGLRHGDPLLAIEQLRIVSSRAQPSGMLPDVMHEEGILASSDDLPPGDLAVLRTMGSPALRDHTIPLTKPPLAALAVQLVAEFSGEEVVDEFVDVILRSQDWWYRESDPHHRGVPAYLHPYSSGLDDSPIFDNDGIVSSPDLLAYLIVQDRLLSNWLRQRGRTDEAIRCTSRAVSTLAALTSRWDGATGSFLSVGESGQPLGFDTVVGLLPLLVDGLPQEMATDLLSATVDPRRYGTPHPLPTVSAASPAFSPDQMWRGPVWVNINWLVARGLRTQGFYDAADNLELHTLAIEKPVVVRSSTTTRSPRPGLRTLRPASDGQPLCWWTWRSGCQARIDGRVPEHQQATRTDFLARGRPEGDRPPSAATRTAHSRR